MSGPLPPGWQESVDKTSGHRFYIHAASSTTTWNDPRSQGPPQPLQTTPKSQVFEAAEVNNTSSSRHNSHASFALQSPTHQGNVPQSPQKYEYLIQQPYSPSQSHNQAAHISTQSSILQGSPYSNPSSQRGPSVYSNNSGFQGFPNQLPTPSYPIDQQYFHNQGNKEQQQNSYQNLINQSQSGQGFAHQQHSYPQQTQPPQQIKPNDQSQGSKSKIATDFVKAGKGILKSIKSSKAGKVFGGKNSSSQSQSNHQHQQPQHQYQGAYHQTAVGGYPIQPYVPNHGQQSQPVTYDPYATQYSGYGSQPSSEYGINAPIYSNVNTQQYSSTPQVASPVQTSQKIQGYYSNPPIQTSTLQQPERPESFSSAPNTFQKPHGTNFFVQLSDPPRQSITSLSSNQGQKPPQEATIQYSLPSTEPSQQPPRHQSAQLVSVSTENSSVYPPEKNSFHKQTAQFGSISAENPSGRSPEIHNSHKQITQFELTAENPSAYPPTTSSVQYSHPYSYPPPSFYPPPKENPTAEPSKYSFSGKASTELTAANQSPSGQSPYILASSTFSGQQNAYPPPLSNHPPPSSTYSPPPSDNYEFKDDLKKESEITSANPQNIPPPNLQLQDQNPPVSGQKIGASSQDLSDRYPPSPVTSLDSIVNHESLNHPFPPAAGQFNQFLQTNIDILPSHNYDSTMSSQIYPPNNHENNPPSDSQENKPPSPQQTAYPSISKNEPNHSTTPQSFSQENLNLSSSPKNPLQNTNNSPASTNVSEYSTLKDDFRHPVQFYPPPSAQLYPPPISPGKVENTNNSPAPTNVSEYSTLRDDFRHPVQFYPPPSAQLYPPPISPGKVEKHKQNPQGYTKDDETQQPYPPASQNQQEQQDSLTSYLSSQQNQQVQQHSLTSYPASSQNSPPRREPDNFTLPTSYGSSQIAVTAPLRFNSRPNSISGKQGQSEVPQETVTQSTTTTVETSLKSDSQEHVSAEEITADINKLMNAITLDGTSDSGPQTNPSIFQQQQQYQHSNVPQQQQQQYQYYPQQQSQPYYPQPQQKQPPPPQQYFPQQPQQRQQPPPQQYFPQQPQFHQQQTSHEQNYSGQHKQQSSSSSSILTSDGRIVYKLHDPGFLGQPDTSSSRQNAQQPEQHSQVYEQELYYHHQREQERLRNEHA
ncbi:hypothetical protein G9A89_011530 [Geosiphon pyriformis]|nr:hypothetical protein G9A89_011530 [Geosiphon pyriformis]